MDIITPQTVSYYDLHEIMKEMERRGYMSQREFWRNYICEWGVNNNTIFRLGFNYYSCTEKEQEYKKYFDEVNKILNLPSNNDGIMVSVNW